MTPATTVLREAVAPALALLAAWRPGIDTQAARRMLLAIAGQESGWTARRQHPAGPARGLWQFERPGGVVGVLTHPVSATLALRLCKARGVVAVAPDVWARLETDDVLAAGMARLLLLTDRAAMPVTEAAGWSCYLRCWRPGKPRPEHWAGRWREAGRAAGLVPAA